MTPVYETHLPLPLHARGKVRDTYALGDALLMIATDRLSAFDVVLPTPIPDKGRILTQLSVFWFRRFESWMPHHLISAEWADIADALRQAGLNPDEYRETLDGRTMLVKRATPIPSSASRGATSRDRCGRSIVRRGSSRTETPSCCTG
jgi:phosphoribosylaminoimidazole-succinocarboxamide synthase